MAEKQKRPAALFKMKALQDTSDVWVQLDCAIIYPGTLTTVNSVVSAVEADGVLYIHIKSQEWTDPQHETDQDIVSYITFYTISA